MSAVLDSRRLPITVGALVHIYAASHYNARGEVTDLREGDPAGAVTVKLRNSGETEKFHACDLETL